MADTQNTYTVELTFQRVGLSTTKGEVALKWGSKVQTATIQDKNSYSIKKDGGNEWEPQGTDYVIYEVSLNQIHFSKQMYSPNLIEVDLMIVPKMIIKENENYYVKAFIPNVTLVSNFAKKFVTLKCDGHDVCKNYYVHDVVPRRTGNTVYLHMKIYSQDKMMTLTESCKAYVSKKLGNDILGEGKGDSAQLKPFIVSNVIDSQNLTVDYSNMRHIKNSNGVEHIFPYLVQYNESFYDFLCRTTNRCGEFLFYEDTGLHIGYKPTEEKDARVIDSYDQLTFQDFFTTHTEHLHDSTYLSEATYDSNVLKSMITKDTYDSVKNTIINIGDNKKGGDVYLMKKTAQFLANNKSLKNFLFDTAVDDLVEVAQQKVSVGRKNDKITDNYFDSGSDRAKGSGASHYDNEKVDEAKKYNEFSEMSTILDDVAYNYIRGLEVKSGQNAVEIAFDTTYPNVSLGETIKVDGTLYLVTEITGYQPEVFTLNRNNYYEKTYIANSIKYRIKAIAAVDSTGFYPSVIPAGHIRKTNAQMAVVVDDFDPNNTNRVRVKFDWQLPKKAEAIDKDTASGLDKSDASPWLFFASASGPATAGIHGRHYLGEKVLVDFAHGNIERPFIVGAVSASVPPALKTSSAVISAPNGEMIRVHEGTGQGAGAFLAGLNPGVKFINSFVPMKIPGEKSARFEGGIDLCDKYGIWSIKGSTDGRNVSISSAWGDVKINAFTGITIAAPNGDIKIQGKNVTIEAGNNLSLISGQNIGNKFISTYGDGFRFNKVSLLADVGQMVLKKVASKALDLCDLSILRSIVEIFFRPLEGTLTVRSNRYLKLEAGGSVAGFPDSLYKAPKKKFDDKFDEMMHTASGMVDILKISADLLKTMMEKYVTLYQDCREKRTELYAAINELKRFANFEEGQEPGKVCNKPYDDNKDKFWNDETKEITEADMEFQANVACDAIDKVNDNCLNRVRGYTSYVGRDNNFLVFTKKSGDDLKKVIIKYRKEKINDVVKKANELLKSIKVLKDVSVGFKADIKCAISTNFIASCHSFPAKYEDALVKAFSKETLKDTLLFAHSNPIKNLQENYTRFDEADKKYMKRVVAKSLVTTWGFEPIAIPYKIGREEGMDHDEILIIKNNGKEVPKTPVSIKDFKNDLLWDLYVQSLSLKKISPKTESGVLKSLGKDFLNKLNFWTPAFEYYSWGNAKNGQILFGADKTYHINPSENGATIAEVADVRYAKGAIDEIELEEKQKSKLKSLDEAIQRAMGCKFQHPVGTFVVLEKPKNQAENAQAEA